ncbi:Sigma 54 modulation protein YhbH [Chitinispirillum alkaliphilum]|nr:Sigma 54 modulation protein YhbH [Chitinispirillum alkaliphilum]
MQIPLEVTYRDGTKTDEIDDLIRRRAAKLDILCDHITSCRVMVEKFQKHQRSGQPYKVRLDIKMPPGHEIVVSRDPGKGDLHLDLGAEVRWAFDTAERKIKALMEKQRGDVKKHVHNEVQGVIARIFRADGTGFIITIDGREVFFHKNSILNRDFDSLKEGLGVRFVETMGEKGPQASTVQIVETPENY